MYISIEEISSEETLVDCKGVIPVPLYIYNTSDEYPMAGTYFKRNSIFLTEYPVYSSNTHFKHESGSSPGSIIPAGISRVSS